MKTFFSVLLLIHEFIINIDMSFLHGPIIVLQTFFHGVILFFLIIQNNLQRHKDPPSLLFDAISPGYGRRFAGFLLWIHVAVSFAIHIM